ncbi:MAG: helix-turn-helix transcriptional regulator [Spirochaetales bacterium]|nr:helix-turn-helix transcriptional regulator [Spirochaetales bacterium]
MLSYLSLGIRNYYQKPIRTIRRGAWEFQAVIQGAISPVFLNKNKQNLQKKTLWVFPPDFSHGWHGEEKTAEIVVFHFSQVADELISICQKSSYISISLEDEEIVQLLKIYQTLHAEFSNPGWLYSLKSRIAADQLALLICFKNKNLLKKPGSDYGRNIVEKAMALFSSGMHLAPNIIEISKEIGVSVSHLRRLFHKIKGANPRSVLEEIRMTRAMELSCFTDYTFLEIANTCGFSDQSAFTKAFCRYWEATPTEARKTDEYKTKLFRKKG